MVEGIQPVSDKSQRTEIHIVYEHENGLLIVIIIFSRLLKLLFLTPYSLTYTTLFPASTMEKFTIFQCAL